MALLPAVVARVRDQGGRFARQFAQPIVGGLGFALLAFSDRVFLAIRSPRVVAGAQDLAVAGHQFPFAASSRERQPI